MSARLSYRPYSPISNSKSWLAQSYAEHPRDRLAPKRLPRCRYVLSLPNQHERRTMAQSRSRVTHSAEHTAQMKKVACPSYLMQHLMQRDDDFHALSLLQGHDRGRWLSVLSSTPVMNGHKVGDPLPEAFSSSHPSTVHSHNLPTHIPTRSRAG